ncbi:baseplate wedge subunit [Synechococcus phage B23]|nr:baseplate wedge subunit [Synechococcus phage B23]
MSLTQFTNLDFDQIKESIRDYLRASSDFTDYDFEGSNFTVLINTLAYNTYINSYNATAICNEVFLDSATLRENVILRAKEIGYLPRSRTAARANISFFVDTTNLTTNPLTLTLKRGTVAVTSARFNSTNYTFSILEDITVPVVDGLAFFDNITVYEGNYIVQNYTFTSNQRIILSNIGIDTSLLSVSVRSSETSTFTQKYNLSKDIFDVNFESKVFFIQEIEDERYEIFFGDDIFGKKLDNGNYIDISYITCLGEEANGATGFTFSGRIFDNNGGIVTSDISRVTVNTPAFGGKTIESVDSIKKYAPKIYSAQNRAVTSSDYEAIVQKIYPEVESISAFGGENLNPPQYGKVFISVKPVNGPFLSNKIKDNIKTTLRKYAVAGIVPEIIDLKYLYIEFDSSIYYNSNFTISTDGLKSNVLEIVNAYSRSSELNKYGARFKYSKFLNLIDESSEAITSNITKISIRRDLRAEVNKIATYEICYGNAFHIANLNGNNIKSSGFYIPGIASPVYLSDIPTTADTGSLFLFTTPDNQTINIVKRNIGEVNYVKGEIILYPLNIRDTVKKYGFDNIIEISVTPKSNDVIALQDLYLQLDVSNSIVNMVIDNISSGADITGSNYISTSSYSENIFTRK